MTTANIKNYRSNDLGRLDYIFSFHPFATTVVGRR
jgi:hypothetical protein